MVPVDRDRPGIRMVGRAATPPASAPAVTWAGVREPD